MANNNMNILQAELQQAQEWEMKMRAKHAMALASVKRLQAMIKELEHDEEAVDAAAPLRFSTKQPVYDQAADIMAYMAARHNLKQGDPLPFGAVLPLRTTIMTNGAPNGTGLIEPGSFWMKVSNYRAALGKAGLSGGYSDPKSITKVIKMLVDLNASDERLEEAYRFYSTQAQRLAE